MPVQHPNSTRRQGRWSRVRGLTRYLTKASCGVALACAAVVGSASQSASAQGSDVYGKGVRLELNKDTGQYFRFISWAQIWNRYIQNNPGTTINGKPSDSSFDVGIRRARFLAFGQVTPDVLVLLHLGINNQTFNNPRKPQVFVHAAWTQFDVIKDALTLGAGLHYWHGVSRMTNASTLNFLAMDAPITNWPTIERQDQFARNLGIFAKGKVAQLDYRLALNKPFWTATGQPEVMDRVENVAGHYLGSNSSVDVAGYFAWEFFDSEGNLLPYTVGTYLGSKKVLNAGLGFKFQDDATESYHPDGTGALNVMKKHNMLLIGADVFADLPMNGGSALTAYGAFYHYDFGPNYIRNIGIMNLGADGTSANGGGNSYPSIGTGNHVYAQVGYLLPGKMGGTQLQPYATAQLSMLEAVDDPATIFELGANWLIVGHHAKVTPHFRSRPVFTFPTGATKAKSTERASELIVQTAMYF